MGAVITHVDDFTLAGTEQFTNNVLEVISRELTVSKVEKDVCSTDDGIEIKMENYIDSLEEIKDIRNADREDDLTKLELKEYRKITGIYVYNYIYKDTKYCNMIYWRNIIVNAVFGMDDLSPLASYSKYVENKMNIQILVICGSKLSNS